MEGRPSKRASQSSVLARAKWASIAERIAVIDQGDSVATTTSDSDHPSPRQRATARLGLFAAAAALAAVSSIAASGPAHAAQGGRQCWAGDSGRACDGVGGDETGTQVSAQEIPAQQLLGQNASPLGGILGGLGTSNLLSGLGIPVGGGGLPLGLGGLGGNGGGPGLGGNGGGPDLGGNGDGPDLGGNGGGPDLGGSGGGPGGLGGSPLEGLSTLGSGGPLGGVARFGG